MITLVREREIKALWSPLIEGGEREREREREGGGEKERDFFVFVRSARAYCM